MSAETLGSGRERVTNAALFRDQAFVAGAWCGDTSQSSTDVVDPATGAVIGAVPNLDRATIERTVATAAEALAPWRALLPQERADVLHRWADLMARHREDLATIVTLEQGEAACGGTWRGRLRRELFALVCG